MRLRTKYILFVVTIHIITIVLSWFAFKDSKLFFIISELFILISVWICIGLYKQLIQPLNMLMTGVDAMRDQDFNVKFLETGKYEMDQLITIYNQMMDKLRDERIKQEQQHFFLQKLINTSPTGIVILDYDENIQQANPKALELMNVEEKEILGRPAQSLEGPIMKEIGKIPSGQSKTITINGIETYKIQKSHFIDRGFARYFVMIEEFTAEILAAEKKAYGKVIRMMAHEVNNTIGPVNSIMQSTLSLRAADDNITQALQVAVDRNNNLNHFMRNFADVVRLPMPVKKPTDLNSVVQDVVKLMEFRAAEKNITISFRPGNQHFMIHADTQQMEQVLINIVKNSIEAIEANGTIELVTGTRKKELCITDSGKGIPPEVEAELFSPFFSTKKDGQGIGLTLIRDILHNHGYEFSLRTEAPGKTVFRILFEP
jgi:two-component system nitrogen regulation sensor histidine kinase NtrY